MQKQFENEEKKWSFQGFQFVDFNSVALLQSLSLVHSRCKSTFECRQKYKLKRFIVKEWKANFIVSRVEFIYVWVNRLWAGVFWCQFSCIHFSVLFFFFFFFLSILVSSSLRNNLLLIRMERGMNVIETWQDFHSRKGVYVSFRILHFKLNIGRKMGFSVLAMWLRNICTLKFIDRFRDSHYMANSWPRK